MNNDDFKDIFSQEQIPHPDENARKVTLNLAEAEFVAEFEKNQKNAKNFQGSGFIARLLGRTANRRSEKMAFSTKKVIYGGLATACVALLVYNVVPTSQMVGMDASDELSTTAMTNGASYNNVGATDGVVPVMRTALEEHNYQRLEGKKEVEVAQAPLEKWKSLKNERAPVTSQSAPPAKMQMADRAVVSGMVAPSSPYPMTAEADSIAVQQQQYFGNDKFEHFDENPTKSVKAEPLSTFSIDVDTASYSVMRSDLDRGVLPRKDAVRVEEMINYFNYDYPLPNTKEQPFSTNVVMKPSPWHAGKQLMTIGIKGYDIPKTQMPNSNLVFLLDVSGSMNAADKLPLLKQSISMLLDTLKPTDTISIVVYAGAAGTVLPPTKVADKGRIMMALQNLSAGGSTAGAEGIRQAYALAEQNFDKNAVNRVILGTDGDFNVGITNREELKSFVEREKEKGIFLSVLGFGRGNYNDAMMQTLAQNGNGTAAYIDSLNEARKVLVEEATSTLFPIAKDVKIQVEFNPQTVAEYRLIGYETRALKNEDFNNDKVDAGDIGAGAEVTAIYELTPVGEQTSIDESRYSPKSEADKAVADLKGELAFVKVRYKLPNENESKLITTPVTDTTGTDNATLKSETDWAVAVASFAQLLKGGKYTGTMTYDDVLKLANEAKGQDPFGYRAEFITLVHKAKTAASLQAQPNGQRVIPTPVDGGVYPYPVPMQR